MSAATGRLFTGHWLGNVCCLGLPGIVNMAQLFRIINLKRLIKLDEKPAIVISCKTLIKIRSRKHMHSAVWVIKQFANKTFFLLFQVEHVSLTYRSNLRLQSVPLSGEGV